MSQFDGSERGWSEDYARLKQNSGDPKRECQLLANATNASQNGRLDVAADAVAEAQELHASHDRVHDHLVDAATAIDHAHEAGDNYAKTARRHCREAAQLLAADIDGDLGFKSGGRFA